jgi:hypothetical protein
MQGTDLLAEPFLDRGVRKLADSTAYVVTIETALAYVETLPPLEPGSVTFVWNTGR